MSRLNRAGAAGLAALCVATVGTFEGLRTRPYHDVVGIPTVCYGETRGVRMGMRFTKPQCDAMLLRRLAGFADGMERCITRPMGDDLYAAFLSFSYNIGTAGFCRSSVARLYNAGERRAACRAIGAYDRAGGRVIPGLVARRRAEQQLCLKGV